MKNFIEAYTTFLSMKNVNSYKILVGLTGKTTKKTVNCLEMIREDINNIFIDFNNISERLGYEIVHQKKEVALLSKELNKKLFPKNDLVGSINEKTVKIVELEKKKKVFDIDVEYLSSLIEAVNQSMDYHKSETIPPNEIGVINWCNNYHLEKNNVSQSLIREP